MAGLEKDSQSPRDESAKNASLMKSENASNPDNMVGVRTKTANLGDSSKPSTGAQKLESQRLKEAREKLRRSHDGLDTGERSGESKRRASSLEKSPKSPKKRARSPDSRDERKSRWHGRSRTRNRAVSRSDSRTSRSRSRSVSHSSRSSSSHSRSRRSPRRKPRARSRTRSRSPYRRGRRGRSRSSSHSRERSDYRRRRSRSRGRSGSVSPRRSRRGRSRSSSYSRDRERYGSSRWRRRSRSRDRRRRSWSRSRSPLRSRRYRSWSRSPHSRGHDSERYRSPRRRSRYGPQQSRAEWYRGRDDYDMDLSRSRDSKRYRRDDELLEPSQDRNVRTVFVWRLIPRVDENDVYSFFSRAGRVRDVQLIMDRRSSRHKGCGYVEFYDKETAKAAVALSGGSICGVPVAVKPSSDEKSIGNDVAGPAATGFQSYHSTPATGAPITSAVGWSARRPRQENSKRASMVPLGVPSPQRPKLASINELKAMLNPHNVPVNPISPRRSMPISPGFNRGSVRDPGPPPPPRAGSNSSAFKRLYVGSVPFQLGEAELHPIFAPFGKIASLQLQRDPGTGRSRGYGFVEYVEHSSAKKALSINGIDVAGRPLRVAQASFAAGSGAADGGIGGVDVAGELDEGRDGVVMNESQKAMLRERLSRGQDFGGNTLSPAGVPWSKPLESTHVPFKSLILSNMFDLAAEQSGFEEELAEDVRDECMTRYGTVTHLFVDKLSRGLVYIRFATIEASRKAMISLNGRWFGGLRVSAAYVSDDVYRKRFPDAV